MIRYKKGMRLGYLWANQSYTPGTVQKVKKGEVFIHWDDNTSTKTSIDWVGMFTKPLNKNDIPIEGH